MLNQRRLIPLLSLSIGLSSAGALSACGNPRTPEGASYKVEVGFQPAKGEVLSPGRPEDVQIVETTKSLPTGVYFGRGLALARDFPSAEAPHRDVGIFFLHETIKFNLDVFKDPAFAARRNDALKKAAAEHGANMVFLLDDQHPDPGVRNVRYHAISVSSAAPVYPSVEDVLSQLKLQDGGFKEIHRFTARVADFGGRTPEPIRFTAGHAYMFAVVFHPGPVDLGMAEKESLGFFVNVDKDPVDRQGLFSEDVGNRYDPRAAIPGVDGVFARGGAGTMEGRSRSVKIELASRSATVRLMKYDWSSGPKPLTSAGVGEADFIVFERKAPQDEIVDEACRFCRNAALSCDKRGPLDACEALRACFKRIEQPSSSCTARYKGL